MESADDDELSTLDASYINPVLPAGEKIQSRSETCCFATCQLKLIDTSYLHLRQLLNNCNSMHNFVRALFQFDSKLAVLTDRHVSIFVCIQLTKDYKVISHQASCASSSSSFSGVSRVVSTELGASLNIIKRLNFAEFSLSGNLDYSWSVLGVTLGHIKSL